MVNVALNDLRDMLSAWLAKRIPTPEMIREQIERVRKLYPQLTDDEVEELAVEFEHIHGVSMDMGVTLVNPGFEKWFDDARADIDFYYWERYRRFLAAQNFSGQVLATLDSVTDRTLGLLENPRKEGRWDRRGMVVGHVQSGKTANYVGLISKAADAGYQVIVIIAGIHNNLRSQTQARIDEGLMGFDSSKPLVIQKGVEKIIGVGRYDSSRRPNAFTNTVRDFDKQTATGIGIPLENLKEPAIFVIKKNVSTLKNLLEWLQEHNARRGTRSISSPMLLVDDEADNASINIKKGSEEVSRINGQIRRLLEMFDRSCYIGYTATPFANIFIDPDTDDQMFGADLFPRDFIVSLEPPINYFGATRVFGEETVEQEDQQENTTVVRHIEDNEDLLPLKHRITHEVVALPRSLKNATRAFVLARAIRLVRGHESSHNSMLVNASRFNGVQRQLRNEIHELISTIRSHVRINSAKPLAEAVRDSEIAALKSLYDNEYGNLEVTWQEVQERLWDSVSPIKIIEVNSQSSESLDYASHPNGLNVIAVGGFSLSRGLTLEGLTISYFLRNSMMYDTLMQMGRWFGYRPGYDDLCRVWMLEEAEGWYAHITQSIEELREEFRKMEVVSATPKDFGLRVRSHPDMLIVTARNKMGSGERHIVSIGLGNRFIETAILRRDLETIQANLNSAIQLANKLTELRLSSKNPKIINGGRLFRNTPVAYVVDFLMSFKNDKNSFLTESAPIRQYIEDRAHTELALWDVFFPGLIRETTESLVDDRLGFPIICQRRSAGKRSTSETLFVSEKQRVSSRGIEAVGLSEDEIETAQNNYREERKLQDSIRNVNYPDRIYRSVRKRPLLVVHLLAIGEKETDLSMSEPIVAWSISFPGTAYEEKKVEYVVNPTWFRERYLQEEDEDEAAGDND